MRDITPEEQILSPCIICSEATLPYHHKFPQFKRNRQKYGWLLDLPFNREYVCPNCHVSHGSVGITRMNEIEFLKELRKWLIGQGIKKP
jgi:hypothetical protein